VISDLGGLFEIFPAETKRVKRDEHKGDKRFQLIRPITLNWSALRASDFGGCDFDEREPVKTKDGIPGHAKKRICKGIEVDDKQYQNRLRMKV
jgi:hypothetical protein